MATKSKGAKRGRPSRRPAARTRAPRTRIPISIHPEETELDEEVKDAADELESDHGPQARMGGYGGFSEDISE